MVTFLVLFRGPVPKWGPGPKKVEKTTPKTKITYSKMGPKIIILVIVFNAVFASLKHIAKNASELTTIAKMLPQGPKI